MLHYAVSQRDKYHFLLHLDNDVIPCILPAPVPSPGSEPGSQPPANDDQCMCSLHPTPSRAHLVGAARIGSYVDAALIRLPRVAFQGHQGYIHSVAKGWTLEDSVVAARLPECVKSHAPPMFSTDAILLDIDRIRNRMPCGMACCTEGVEDEMSAALARASEKVDHNQERVADIGACFCLHG